MNTPTLHLICNAHLDPVWQWQWEEGASEALSTFRTAVTLLHEHPDFIFTHNEAILYRWVEELDPSLFSEIRLLIQQGRWHIGGGWLLQPDVNIPNIESLIRHITVGRKYFKEKFGAQSAVAYNFDSFGHSAGLPQILNQAGYKMYMHLRPEAKELNLPSSLYRWRGADGSEILGYRIEVGLYHTEYENLSERLNTAAELALKEQRDVAVTWGIGDHGGGATREDLARIESFMKTETRVRTIYSTPDRFYEAIKEFAESAPIVEGDIQRVFTGCYTSLSRVKRRANKSLVMLTQTEALTAAAFANGARDNFDALNAVWESHLFNDFHDILPGSCTEPAEQDALDLYGKAESEMRKLRLAAAVRFNSGTPKDHYLPLTVLNANPSAADVPVEFECMSCLRPKWTGKWHLQLFDASGNEIASQEEQPEALLPFNGWRRKVSFAAHLPHVGSAHYYLLLEEGEKLKSPTPFKIPFGINAGTGLVNSLPNSNGAELLSRDLLQPLLVEDTADSWGADVWNYNLVSGTFALDKKSAAIIEQGPIRTVYESLMTCMHSSVRFHTIAYSGFDFLEYRLRILWNETRERLKLEIPLNFSFDSVICEVPGGIIARPADGETHVHGRWCLIRNEADNTCVAIVHNGLHAIDAKNNTVFLSVLRGAAYCHEQHFELSEYPIRKYMDSGAHDVRLIVLHGTHDDVLPRLTGLADFLASPPAVYPHLPAGSFTFSESNTEEPIHQKEFLHLEPVSLRMLALKKAAASDGFILRVQETTGNPCAGTFSVPSLKITQDVQFSALEIKTFLIDKSGTVRSISFTEE